MAWIIICLSTVWIPVILLIVETNGITKKLNETIALVNENSKKLHSLLDPTRHE